jgi:hypothetical protein
MLRLAHARIGAVKATGVLLTRAVEEGIDLRLARAKRQGRPTVEARPAKAAAGCADQAA